MAVSLVKRFTDECEWDGCGQAAQRVVNISPPVLICNEHAEWILTIFGADSYAIGFYNETYALQNAGLV